MPCDLLKRFRLVVVLRVLVSLSTTAPQVHNLWTTLWTSTRPTSSRCWHPPHRWRSAQLSNQAVRPPAYRKYGFVEHPPSVPPHDLIAIWNKVLGELQPFQRAWLRASEPVTLHADTLIIAVANDFTRMQIEGRLRAQLEDALSHAFGQEVRLAVSVDPNLEEIDGEGIDEEDFFDPEYGGPRLESRESMRDLSINPFIDTEMFSGTAAANEPVQTFGGTTTSSQLETRLNPKYTFETFVIGSSNRFPHAAAVAVAEAPGKSYNPLLIYGDSGLGKTHLLHAIGHYVRSLYAGAKVRYVSSEEFTNEFINAIRDDRQDRFKRRYRDVDVLLIDDIQFLEGKTQTQEEFFHTFNTLHNANKQIVLTSDRAPKRLEALEDRQGVV